MVGHQRHTGRMAYGHRAGGPTGSSPAVSTKGAHPIAQGVVWYAIRVRPQQRQMRRKEYASDPLLAPFVVEGFLRDKGFETFVPRVAVFRKVNGYATDKISMARPMLVGWMFVGMDGNRWRDLMDTPGVIGPGGDGGRIYTMTGERVEHLRQRWDGGFRKAHRREKFMQSGKEFGPGSQARVTDGPFAGFTGPVVQVRGKHATLLMNMLGMQREVEVDSAMLEAA